MMRIVVAVAVVVAALGLVACGGGSSTSAKQQHLNELADEAPGLSQTVAASAALLDLSNGDTAGAEAELAEACPDTDPSETLEHLEEVRQAQGSREELEAELKDLC